MKMARGVAPAEVMAPPADAEAYEEWRQADTLRAPYKVPNGLLRGLRVDVVESLVECPLLCFVNARSGGRMGADLALLLSQAVGRVQVFDIGDKDFRPDKVLSKFYENLRSMEAAGDSRAATVRQRVRLLVCGGDGTIAWLMGVIKKLKLQPEPPIAILPLGTGNDLARSFLWGAAYDKSWILDHKSMYKTLRNIACAKDDRLDCWNITITTPRKGMFNHGVPHCLSPPQPPAVAGAQTPHTRPSIAVPSVGGYPYASTSTAYGRGQSSGLTMLAGGSAAGLHAAAARDSSAAGAGERSVPASVVATLGSATPLQNIATSSVGSAATTFTTATNMSMHTGAAQAGTSVPPTIVSGAVSTSAEDETGIGVLGGMFWNYFSVGLDAKAAWGFHSLREARPGCTSSRTANQFWYSFFSCASGWFCCAQALNIKVTLEVLKPGPDGAAAGWQPVKLPLNVKALIVLNLQSYAGGRNLWGPKTNDASKARHGFKDPSYNDGLLEVVGLQSGWHTGIVMASKGSLLHARRICQAAGVRLAIHAPYVRSDGEPSHCYMQVDGEPWMQDIPIKGQETPVRVEIVHAGVSHVLRNDPREQSYSRGAGPRKSALRSTPLVTATPEPINLQPPAPAVVPTSQSSLQLPVHQPQAAPAPSASASGALPQQATHGSQSGASHSAWARIASGGRPSAASAAGSSTAAGVDPVAADGGGGGGAASNARVGWVAAKPSDPAEGSTPGGDAQSHANESPTPRTLSTDLGSQGGRSMALPE